MKKESNTVNVLEKIYLNPEKYIQNKELTLLESFLMGYTSFCIAQNYRSANDKEVETQFKMWMRSQFGISKFVQISPEQIIRLTTKNEEEAYEKFFELWFNFLAQYNKGC